MLRSLRTVSGCWLRDADGEPGKPKDWLFDFSQWTVRYLRVETCTWPVNRSVLVAPFAFSEINDVVSVVYLNIALKSLADGPRGKDHRTRWRLRGTKPCRQTESIIDNPSRTTGIGVDTVRPLGCAEGAITRDPHLRSWREVLGYAIQTTDARIGHLSDLIAEEYNWTIQFLVVDIGDWWGGRKLLVRPDWVESLRCSDSLVRLNVGTQVVCDAPWFNSSSLSNDGYQEELLDIYYRQEVDE